MAMLTEYVIDGFKRTFTAVKTERKFWVIGSEGMVNELGGDGLINGRLDRIVRETISRDEMGCTRVTLDLWERGDWYSKAEYMVLGLAGWFHRKGQVVEMLANQGRL